MKKHFFTITLLLAILASSCTPYKSLLNYSEAPRLPEVPQEILNYKPLKIEVNDALSINVSSIDALSLAPFTFGGESSKENVVVNTYLVSSDGTIVFPTIGKIKVDGLTIDEAQEQIANSLKPYFKEAPIVQVRLANFKINVNGEVSNPGVFLAKTDRMSIIEAMTLAGDFTPYSMRDSILIIREENGFREFGYVNFNNAELFDSEYFYLKQNDVIYVRPQKTKIASIRDPANRYLPWITATVTVIALAFSISR